MAQVFQVLRCFQCETFQVQQRKKTNKWQCKLCNAKQSIIKVFAEGVAAECRKHVQKLNLSRAETMPTPSINPADSYTHHDSTGSDSSERGSNSPHFKPMMQEKFSVVGEGGETMGGSKWSAFIDPVAAISSEDSSQEDDEESIYETGRTDKGQVYRRISGEEKKGGGQRKPRTKRPRVSGFHPVDTTQTDSASCTNNTGTAHPYSTITQDMQSVLKSTENDRMQRKLTSSKSDNFLGESSHDGRYKPLGNRDDVVTVSKSIGDLKKAEKSTNIDSKWSKYLPEFDND